MHALKQRIDDDKILHQGEYYSWNYSHVSAACLKNTFKHSKKYTHVSAVTMRQVYIHKRSGWNMCDKSNQMMLNKMAGPGHASEINMMASQMRGLKMEDEFQQDYE
jgi:hypothetical protein